MNAVEAPAPVVPVVEARQVVRSHPGDAAGRRILDGVDLRVDRGEVVAITGRSGSGKTTLLQLLGLLDTPTSGSIRFAGEDAARLRDAERTERRGRAIGFVFQQFSLLPTLTIAENVAVPLLVGGVPIDERAERVEAALAAVDLAGTGDRRPASLSGGEQQRVAIARALVHRPVLVLADEPTGNLDSQSAAVVLALLTELAPDPDRAVVVVTHDVNVAAGAGRTVRLLDGRLVDG